MRWTTAVGLLLIAGSAYVGRDLMADSKHPWPAYAEPQVDCGLPLGGVHEGSALRLRYPDGWKVTERADPEAGIVQTFLVPGDGSAEEVTLFLREVEARLSTIEVPKPAGGQPKLKDAPAAAPPPSGDEAAPAEPTSTRLPDTEQPLDLGQDRNGNAYLTRTEEGPKKVSFSWMAFVWDKQGRTTVVSGPKLVHSNWPPMRNRGRKLNCAFWSVLKTVEAK